MKYICKKCKKPFNGRKAKKRKYCSRKCFFLAYGRKLQNYEDGDTKTEYRWSGNDKSHKKYLYRYVYIKKRKAFIEEHRLVMGEKMGRPLKPTDIVHHINEDTLDNRVENLRVFESPSDHLKAHGRARLEGDGGWLYVDYDKPINLNLPND